MADIKFPDDPKVKRLLVIAVVAAHADTLERDNELVKAAVKSGEMQRIIEASARYSAELAVLRRLVPTSTEVNALIEGVSTAARLNGMDISDYAPAGDMPGDYFDARKYSFSVTGPYHRVAEFLTAVGSLDRIIVPMNLQIVPSGRKVERRPQKDEIFVDVKFELMTYITKTLPP